MACLDASDRHFMIDISAEKKFWVLRKMTPSTQWMTGYPTPIWSSEA